MVRETVWRYVKRKGGAVLRWYVLRPKASLTFGSLQPPFSHDVRWVNFTGEHC